MALACLDNIPGPHLLVLGLGAEAGPFPTCHTAAPFTDTSDSHPLAQAPDNQFLRSLSGASCPPRLPSSSDTTGNLSPGTSVRRERQTDLA